MPSRRVYLERGLGCGLWMLIRRSRLGAFLVVSLFLGHSGTALSAPGDDARQRASKSVEEVESEAKRLSRLRGPSGLVTPEERVAAAELHFRTKHYDAAIDTLSKVVELRAQAKASESTEADAHFLLGKAYFATEQLYSSKRHFEIVTDKADEPSYGTMGGPAASRLVDIALSIQRRDTLPDVLARVDRMLAKASNDSLRYARAKALYAMERYSEARAECSVIGKGSLYSQRGAYLGGTALMKEAEEKAGARGWPDYAEALAAFRQATHVSSKRLQDQVDAERISVLAWLAIARLHYAVGRYGSASDAYQKVPRSSELFSQALFELAWTYVRLGDYERAQGSLEALSVLDPGLIDGADGELLRGDLLLRSRRFEEADAAYNGVRTKYDPLRLQVFDYIKKNTNPAKFYDKLTAAEIETGHELPTLAIEWAREEAEEERVFAIVDDVARSRALVKRSRRIVSLLRASLSSESRSRLFPEIQKRLQEVLSLLNRLAIARLSLAEGLDEVAKGGSAELEGVRARRRKLMGRLRGVPTTPGNFSIRQSVAEETWNRVSQELQRLQLEADHLRALVNGLRRVVGESENNGLAGNVAKVKGFRAEIAENEKDLQLYFRRINGLRRKVELARVQVGFGDDAFLEDERIRNMFRDLLSSELQLSVRAASEGEARYARSLQPVLRKIASVEGGVLTIQKQIERLVDAQAQEMRQVVESEAQSIEVHASRLDTMDQHARLLVGQVAQETFVKVRDRLADVVLRADVGSVQQSWEVREGQRDRVRALLRQRAREERLIEDEMSEVMDDSPGGRL